MRKVFLFLVCIVAFRMFLFAHDPSLTYSQIIILKNKIEVKCVIPIDHLMQIASVSAGKLDTIIFDSYFKENFKILNDSQKCIPALVDLKEMNDINSYSFIYEFNCPKTVNHLHFKNTLFLDVCNMHTGIVDFILAEQTSQLVFSNDFTFIDIPVNDLLNQWGKEPFYKNEGRKKVKEKKIIQSDSVKKLVEKKKPIDTMLIEEKITTTDTSKNDSLIFSEIKNKIPPSLSFSDQSIFDKCRNFFVLGINHILLGYDHILFLFGLLLIASGFLDIAKIVTSFTIAHSITLIVASLGIFVLPSRITESLIALSIAYIAYENIFLNPKKRWLITFFIGLIHGFGFSSVLREIGLPEKGLIISLLSFNVGVEAGQMGIVIILLPVLWHIRKKSWNNSFVKYFSLAIGMLGLFWFFSRAFF